MTEQTYIKCATCPGVYPVGKFDECPACDNPLSEGIEKSVNSRQMSQSGTGNIQAGGNVKVVVQNNNIAISEKELKNQRRTIKRRIKDHRADLVSKLKLSYISLAAGITSLVAGVLKLVNSFNEFESSKAGESLNAKVVTLWEFLGQIGSKTASIYMVVSVAIFVFFVMMPVFNIYYAWVVDDEHITTQKELLKKIRKQLSEMGIKD